MLEDKSRGDGFRLKTFFVKIKYFNCALIVLLSSYFFIIPVLQIWYYSYDCGLRNGEVPGFVYRWHKCLSGKYARWAMMHIESGRAAEFEKEDVKGTEWPVFGSVFYLWATEALQEDWERNRSHSGKAPNEYAAESIEAATALITDPGHAAWVKEYWGDDYLTRENLFYRMLIISGMTSYQKLTGNNKYEEFLYEQVESLAEELDASRHGLLDDYPAQCYPIDIVAAIANIKRADSVLGTDHSEIIARAVRGFEGDVLDPETGLVAYNVSARSGKGYGSARGVGQSFMLIWAPDIWEDTAKDWCAKYDEYFWQENWLMSGFREFPKFNTEYDWSVEVDAGPIVDGFGVAANAFGIGATRANGRMDQAYKLSVAGMLVSWPMPDGTLLIPRLLSNISDSPYLGESALLFCYTRVPQLPVEGDYVYKVPQIVYLGLSIMFLVGMIYIVSAIRDMRKVKLWANTRYIPFPKVQFVCLVVIYIVAIGVFVCVDLSSAIFVLLFSQLLPRTRKVKKVPVDSGG